MNNLHTLHEKLVQKRKKILQNIQNQETLDTIGEELKEEYKRLIKIEEKLNKWFNKYSQTRKKNNSNTNNSNTNNSNTNTNNSNTNSRRRRTKTKKQSSTRQRVNPEFARLGIPIPPSQQVGSPRVPLGQKPKTD